MHTAHSLYDWNLQRRSISHLSFRRLYPKKARKTNAMTAPVEISSRMTESYFNCARYAARNTASQERSAARGVTTCSGHRGKCSWRMVSAHTHMQRWPRHTSAPPNACNSPAMSVLAVLPYAKSVLLLALLPHAVCWSCLVAGVHRPGNARRACAAWEQGSEQQCTSASKAADS